MEDIENKSSSELETLVKNDRMLRSLAVNVRTVIWQMSFMDSDMDMVPLDKELAMAKKLRKRIQKKQSLIEKKINFLEGIEK